MPSTRPEREPFIGKRIVVFTAHPDDEQLAAGTMYKNHAAGGETFLICATAGEKGKSHLTKPVTDAALKKIRKSELTEAGKILKIDKIIFFNFPDASVRAHKKELYGKALPVIQEIKPDYILSFGPDGVSGHWDHITVGEVALSIAKKLNIPMAAFTLSDTMKAFRRTMIVSRRKFGSYTDLLKHRSGDIKIEIDPAIKRKAFSVHRSQFTDGGWIATVPKRIAARFFRYEHFVKEVV